MKKLISATEVAEICQVKQSKAYNIIRQINYEMESKGYVVIKGRVNRDYLFERLGILEKEIN